MSALLEKIIPAEKQIVILDLFLNREGDWECLGVILKRKKQEISHEIIKDIQFPDQLPIKPKSSVVLHIRGRGIVTRKVPELVIENEHVLEKIMPNVSADDFAVQQFITEEDSFVSIIRKNQLDTILEELKAKKINIVNVSLGSAVLAVFKELVYSEQQDYSLSGSKLSFNQEGVLKSIQSSEEALSNPYLTFGEETIDEKYAHSVAAGIYYWYPSFQAQGIDSDEINHLRENHWQKRIFNFSGATVLGISFIILIFNFLIFDKYKQDFKGLYQVSVQNESTIQLLDNLKSELQQKNELIKTTGILKESRIAFCSDLIAESVPSSIDLKRLKIHPLDGKIKKKDRIKFDFSTIEISGEVDRSATMHHWIEEIKFFKWIKEVKIINYQINEFGNGDFTIHLKIKED